MKASFILFPFRSLASLRRRDTRLQRPLSLRAILRSQRFSLCRTPTIVLVTWIAEPWGWL
jgi:hypothetical protein